MITATYVRHFPDGTATVPSDSVVEWLCGSCMDLFGISGQDVWEICNLGHQESYVDSCGLRWTRTA